MSDFLNEWQARLDQHFKDLAASRSETNFGIFAIEHGLKEDEVDEISRQLLSRVQEGLRLSPHWLLWVIYSTEHGYQYNGDEYWISFEELVPLWNNNRNQLAQWFNKFQTNYNGIVPTGRWADHFSIISRPITHAILPKYLQVQFARMLYDQRYSLVELTSLDPDHIGRRLSGNAYYSSTRFRAFLQQEELAGRIVLALLGEQPEDGIQPIYPPTLERIVKDLEEVRNAREWLVATRKFVKDRFVGIAHGLPGADDNHRTGERRGTEGSVPEVRPKLYLSHRGRGNWIAWVEFPSFKNLCSLSADIQSFVRSTRCRVNGSKEFKPGGWLLFRNRKCVLKQWPDPGKPMICFERSEERIENILQTECRIGHGPKWLYRVGVDGTAREITGGVVRPGARYIIVSRKEQSQLQFGMRLLDIDCEGIWAYRLDVPSDVSADFTEWLSEFGLDVARTVRVWPAGLPARGWDGEGLSEWLTTETPCIGMVHDHEIDGYMLQLNGEDEIMIDAGVPGEPVFVQLPRLLVGNHVLLVKARRSSELDEVVSTPEAEGYIELRVREPEPWIPGVASHCGLIANLDPHDANLETLWRNEVSLSVWGPESRSVTAKIRLKNRKGDELLSEPIGNPMKLPLRPDTWHKKFDRFLESEKNTWIYLEAASGELEISAEELGRISFPFEHDAPPLRWVLEANRNQIIFRLVDDTGCEDEESELEVSIFSMETPLSGCPFPSDKALAGHTVERPGGLLYAKRGEFEDFVVVSGGITGQGLKGLGVDSDYSRLRNIQVLPVNSLVLYAKWHNARLYGPLVKPRWQKIRRKYLSLIYEKLCGWNWAKAEESFSSSLDSEDSLNTFQQLVGRGWADFSMALRRECEHLTGDVSQRRNWFIDMSNHYHVCVDPILSEFAFRLASEAHQVPEVYRSDLGRLLTAVRGKPVLIRGARFLHLLTL